MTELHGRHARWTAAALLAPASAAVFAGTMSWTTGQSAAAAETTATNSTPSATVDPLQAKLDYQTRRVALLRKQVSTLRQQVEGDDVPSASPTGASARKASGSTRGSSSGGSTTARSTKAASKPAATKTTAPATKKAATTKPAPATSTTTKAS
jgi:hypothetical protein